MEYRQLKYFVAVAEELSFVRAARRLNISQPPLSVQIKLLEEELGACLLERDNRNVHLTSVGKALLEHARALVKQFEETRAIVERAQHDTNQKLRIGFSGAVAQTMVFRTLLSEFRQRFPGVTTDIQHLPTRTQLDAIDRGELEVGIIRPSPEFEGASNLATRILLRDRLCAFIPAGHDLASSHSALSMKALAGQRLVSVSAKGGCGVRAYVVALARSVGMSSSEIEELADTETVFGVVANGNAIGILPDCYGVSPLPGTHARPIDSDLTQSRLMIAVRHPYVSAAARQIIELVDDL